ncbi:MAG TPA: hypothetical protein PKO15_17960 [Fibrobacteria bacterium]|nr:hypothetical protein [Fibrobacteria bacterium]HOX52406.1 hypothetical protein [Fibrobacteria bacterium]
MNAPLRAGVSIVEVLVAIVILSLAIPMVAGFSTTSKKVQVAANEMENATAAAQSIIDSLSLFPAFMLESGTPKARTIQGPTRIYTASWTYTAVGAHSGVANVTVAWNQAGKPHSISVTGEVP